MTKVTFSILLACLLLGNAQGRVWRSPPSSISIHPSTVGVMRGGDDSKFSPQVPDDTLRATASSNFHSDVARGGSTQKRKLKTSTISTRSIQTTTTTTTTPSTIQAKASKVQESASPDASVVDPTKNLKKKSVRGTPEDKRHKRIAKKLKNRNATNLRRKILHASWGFLFAALNHIIPKAKFVPGMACLTGATLIMELFRYRKGFEWINDTLHFFLGSSLRKHEMDGKFTGSFYYFLGVTLSAAFYSKTCATLGICQLAIADPAASYFGRATRHVYWSRIENGLGGIGRNKGWLGFLGGALCCVPMNYKLLSMAQFGVQPTKSAILLASVALGMAGAFADLAVPTPTLTLPKKVFGVRVPPFHIDDNTVVPVFSAFACQQIFQYFKFPADLALGKFLIV